MDQSSQVKQHRKLQVSGGSTHVVSIPKPWVQSMGLKTGDGISMIKNENNSLTLFPKEGVGEQRRSASVVIGPADSDESIRRKIVAMYLSGYKTIRIAARGIRLGPGQMNTIRSFARYSMIGTEIIESSLEHVTIRTLTRLPEMTSDVALSRMAAMTSDMHQEALAALESADVKYADEVIKLDDEVDRFTFYMLRNLTVAVGDAGLLRAMSLNSPVDCLYYRTVVARIERIADHAALVAKQVKYLTGSVDPAILQDIRELSTSVMDMFGQAVDALIRCDYGMAEDVGAATVRAQKAQESIVSHIPNDDPNITVIKFVLDSIRRSAEYTMDIAEVVMDRNVESILAR